MIQTHIDIETTRIGVVGAGSWGTALANLLASKGFNVAHWVYEPEVMNEMRSERQNRPFLPGVTLSDNLHPSCDLASVVADKDLLLVVTPSHVTRDTMSRCGAGRR